MDTRNSSGQQNSVTDPRGDLVDCFKRVRSLRILMIRVIGPLGAFLMFICATHARQLVHRCPLQASRLILPFMKTPASPPRHAVSRAASLSSFFKHKDNKVGSGGPLKDRSVPALGLPLTFLARPGSMLHFYLARCMIKL